MRHAEVSYFRADGSPVDPAEVPLNEDGVAQAHAVAEAFRAIDLDRVVTSGLPRTLETAAHRRAAESSPSRGPSCGRSRAAASRRSLRTRSSASSCMRFAA